MGLPSMIGRRADATGTRPGSVTAILGGTPRPPGAPLRSAAMPREPKAHAARAALTVVHVDTETGFSGGEVQVLGLVRGLAARGVAQLVATPSDGALAPRVRELGLSTAHVRAANDLDVRSIWRLAQLFVRARADVVHLHTGRAAWIGGIAARLARVPAVVTRRQDKRLVGSWKRAFVYRRLAAAAIGIAPRVSEQILATGADARRVGTIWSSVDPARLVPSANREALRARLGLTADDFVVASAAQLVERKGLDVLVAALAHTDRSRPIVVLIAGDGEERARLEALAHTVAAPHRVALLGHVANVADVLAAADAFALPSRAEGLGVAALEAMALGRAVVATEVGGLSQAVANCGLLVPPDDAPALGAALARLALDPDLVARLGAAAARRVHDVFLFEAQVAAYAQLYERVRARDPAPTAFLTQTW
jgi:glycosyltransferase involved in cell wall biosynthesis